MWHPKRQVCVPVPFTCPLFQVLNYPVTFCWKSSTKNVTSVIKPMERAICPQGTSPWSFLWDFSLLGWFAPLCSFPHAIFPTGGAHKETPAQLLHRAPQGHKSWEGDSGSRRVVFGACSSKVELKTLLLGIEIIAAGVGQSL